MPFVSDTWKTKYQRQIENKGVGISQNYKPKESRVVILTSGSRQFKTKGRKRD